MTEFYEIEPSLENYWRSIILFGRNVASYKFALAKALYDLKDSGDTVITLDKLAAPFAKHITEHLIVCDKQGISANSKFLNGCRAYNAGNLTHDELIELTVKMGFSNVIDAFHNVHQSEVPSRFFMDERKTKGGIILTDNFFKLGEQFQYGSLVEETEARWRLVETAWELNLPKYLIQIDYKEETREFFADNKLRRVAVTPASPALNGYQKGKCFYCFRDISIDKKRSEEYADVDHFFPHTLRQCDSEKPINGVANLVLSCVECNRGEKGKFAQLPSIDLLTRLSKRNEYLITSHHPLRETLIMQTGNTRDKRKQYLQDAYSCSISYFGIKNKWEPQAQAIATF